MNWYLILDDGARHKISGSITLERADGTGLVAPSTIEGDAEALFSAVDGKKIHIEAPNGVRHRVVVEFLRGDWVATGVCG